MGYFIITMQRGRCPVSWHLQNQVDQNAQAGLYKSVYETAVMRALASFANDDGGSCFPSLVTLAARSQCSQSTVRRVLQQFKKRKWIAIKHTGRSNIYQISPHGCVEPKAVHAAFGRQVTTRNAEKPSNSRERMVSETIQNSQPDQSECSLGPFRTVSETNDSHQVASSDNPCDLSLWDGADAPVERENVLKEGGEQEEPFSFATVSEGTTRRLPRTPSATRGAHSAMKCYSAKQSHVCECDSEHPPGMPSLEEIRAEMRKLGAPDEYAEELHDTWLSTGFRTKSGPIRDWRASLRGWVRWRDGR
jgi:hypothetical protein